MPFDVIRSPEAEAVVGVEVAGSRRQCFFTMNVLGMTTERRQSI